VPARSRVIRLCTALPEVEIEEGQHVGFSVRGKRFAWLLEDHHGDGRLALNCKAPRGENAALAEREPERFFLPSYLGSRGWVGVWLDTRGVDWDAVERLLTDAYLLTAPKRLAGRVADRDAATPPAPPGRDSA
jgi:hypothetical protein